MKKFFAISFFIFLFLQPAMAQPPRTAIELNNYFSHIVDSMYNKGQIWGQAYAKATESKDFSALAPLRKDLEKFIDHTDKDLKAMKDIGGSKAYRVAMIHFLAFEKQLSQKGLLPFEKLDARSTTAQMDAANQHLSDLAAEETAELDKVAAAQKEYAAKNGFTIEEKKE